MTMIANAMWYRTEENNDSTQSFQFGPISFTVHQLYTSVMSSLICVPPVLIITILFRKAKSRPRKKAGPMKELQKPGQITTENNNVKKADKSQSPHFRDLNSISSVGSVRHQDNDSTLEMYLTNLDDSDLDDTDDEIDIKGTY